MKDDAPGGALHARLAALRALPARARALRTEEGRRAAATAAARSWAAFRPVAKRLAPGLGVALLMATAAKFLSEHYGAPALLMALLLGLAFHFLHEDGRIAPGVDFAARTVLRIGVALLGARISLDLIAALGAPVLGLMAAAVAGTILFALAAAPLVGRGWRLALLTGGAVAICGASAAAAVAAVLPATERSERDLSFTVIGVTVLSTLAMIVYPIVLQAVGADPLAMGVILGGSIHDVAQVVGAGFTVSEEVGDTATLVKLIRVTLLAPVILILTLGIRFLAKAEPKGVGADKRPPLIPGFLIAFMALGAVASSGLAPQAALDGLAGLSRWALVTAIAAVGVKTDLKSIAKVGGGSIALIVSETVVIAAIVVAGVAFLL